MKLLVLRPEPGATETLRKARERSLDAVAVPLFRVEAVDWQAQDPRDFDGILLTSANAVRHAGPGLGALKRLPVYAVGEATAAAAREAGFRVAEVGNGGANQLLALLDPGLKLIHLCGEQHKETGAEQAIIRVVVYRSQALEAPDLSIAAATAALIHSPRAGKRFAELVSERESIAIIAISSAAAEAAGTGWKSIQTADQPTDEALLALAAGLCNNDP